MQTYVEFIYNIFIFSASPPLYIYVYKCSDFLLKIIKNFHSVSGSSYILFSF